MSNNLSSSLIGYSLLTGTNGFSAFGANVPSFESLAVRKAKAAFTTPATQPPWKSAAQDALSAQASNIRKLSTIIDESGSDRLPSDVRTTFTAYKALDKLRILAEAAADSPVSSVRVKMQEAFARGLEDLQSYLATAPSEKVRLSFDKATARVQSVGLVEQSLGTISGAGVATARDAPLANVSGSEVLNISLSRNGLADTIRVDLSTSTQPPTLDSVSQAINSAIAAVAKTDANGNPELDSNGDPVPRWNVTFTPDKSSGSWGMRIDNPAFDTVSIDQEAAPDALMVATGMTALDAASTTKIIRFDDPAGTAVRRNLAEIASLDALATERAELAAKDTKTIEGVEPPPTDVYAATQAAGMVTDASGASYIVGTAAGDLGSNRLAGTSDIFLTKLDSEGRVEWQRAIGSSETAQAAGISLAPDGGVVVTGTVEGNFDGSQTDGDILVTKFDAAGDEQFSTLVRAVGADTASSVAVGADGSIYVGGRSAARDASITRLDASGAIRERRTIDSGSSDTLSALAVDSDGSLLVLTREGGEARLRRLDSQNLSNELGSYNLGTADARALAIGADGTIAVAGATSTALNGTQAGAGLSGGRDGFLARISADFSGASVTYVGTGSDDQIDSVSEMNGSFYVGGRTKGALDGNRTGTVDGFVAQISSADGSVGSLNQFGLVSSTAEPVRVSSATGGASVLGALGLSRGVLSSQDSTKLTAQTSLRAGDEFSIRVNDGAVRRITIGAGETLTDLADRIRRITGSKANITTPIKDGVRQLQLDAKAGQTIELIAGRDGRDALEKLGIDAIRLSVPEVRGENAPKVTPGGAFGLSLTQAFDISTKAGAGSALAKIKSAISMTQTAYRSLYWDDSKAALVNGSKAGGGGVSPYLQSQISRYQDALTRISSLT